MHLTSDTICMQGTSSILILDKQKHRFERVCDRIQHQVNAKGVRERQAGDDIQTFILIYVYQ